MRLLIVTALLLFGIAAATEEQDPKQDEEWTTDEVQTLKGIMHIFFGQPGFQRRAPGALRLAFHDCVGGCDGCINLNNPGNFGLEHIIENLEDLYAQQIPFPPNGKTMSRADFYNLAGIVAVEYSIDFNNFYCKNPPECLMSQIAIEFMMGRADCPTSPTTNVDVGLPFPSWDHTQLMAFWQDRFGMDPRETTAILGGHTLGGFHPEASGYTGNWKEGDVEPLSFNNDFYSLLLDPTLTWNHFDNAASKRSPKGSENRDPNQRYQWKGLDAVGETKTFMVDIDVDLILDLDIIDLGGESTCDFDTCENAPTRMFVEMYAAEPDLWLNDFACAYEKMTSAVPEPKLLRKPIGGPVGTSSKSGAKAIACVQQRQPEKH